MVAHIPWRKITLEVAFPRLNDMYHIWKVLISVHFSSGKPTFHSVFSIYVSDMAAGFSSGLLGLLESHVSSAAVWQCGSVTVWQDS